MAKAQVLEVGTIVKLKSGGPDMTVKGFTNTSHTVACQWFAGKKLENGLFPTDSLEFVKPEPKGNDDT